MIEEKNVEEKQMNMQETIEVLKKGIDDLIGEEELIEKLQAKKILKVKLGLDPSAPDIHLGHTVVLRKLKAFQDLGHEIHIIIGDFTGMIGDPTGKSSSRKQLSEDEVFENSKTYTNQIFEILDQDKTIIHFNSTWLSKLNLKEIIELTQTTTVARMLEREDFKKRFQSNAPIGIHEFLYPLMQAYDSLMIEADVELGGSDQRFNLLMGRTLQKSKGKSPQTVIMMPLLEGLDGIHKMSKSLNNYVGVHDTPLLMFEKIMTLPDSLIMKYFTLLTDLSPSELKEMEARLHTENPRDIKLLLAEEITRSFHGEAASKMASEEFILIFQKNSLPTDIPEVKISSDDFSLGRTLKESKLVGSLNEYRRLLSQSGVSIDGHKIHEEDDIPKSGTFVVTLGKKKFLRIILE